MHKVAVNVAGLDHDAIHRYNFDPSMGECLLLAGNSATGTVNAAFFTIILLYRISQFISLHVMTNDEIK